MLDQCDSIEEAKTKAEARAETYGQVHIVPIGGKGHKVVPGGTSYRVKATLRWTHPSEAPVEGWYFFGLAAS